MYYYLFVQGRFVMSTAIAQQFFFKHNFINFKKRLKTCPYYAVKRYIHEICEVGNVHLRKKRFRQLDLT